MYANRHAGSAAMQPPLTPPIDLHRCWLPSDPGPILGLGGAEPDAAAAGWREHRPALRRRLPADLSSPERRAGREGHVVRVLIGVDGRVKQVERVSATSGAFFAATRAQAFAKWRFTPATRGDAPVEQWKQMRVSLVPENE